MIRVRRQAESIGPGAGSVIDPIQSTAIGHCAGVTTRSPGSRSSMAIGPQVVLISVPRTKAECAESSSGVAGAVCSVSWISPLASSHCAR